MTRPGNLRVPLQNKGTIPRVLNLLLDKYIKIASKLLHWFKKLPDYALSKKITKKDTNDITWMQDQLDDVIGVMMGYFS